MIRRERWTAVIDVTAGAFLGNPGGLILVDPVTGEVLETPVLVPEPVRQYRASDGLRQDDVP